MFFVATIFLHLFQNPLKADFYSGGAGLYSQQMPRAKETLSRLGTTRVSSEKNYDAVYTNSDFSKDHPRTCEICRRSETILNPILICTSCKVHNLKPVQLYRIYG